MTALIPAFLEIISKVVHFWRLALRRLPFGKLPSPQPAPNGLPSDPQDVADSHLRMAGIGQVYDLLIAIDSAFSAQLGLRGWCHRRRGNVFGAIAAVGWFRYSGRIFDGRQNQLPGSFLEYSLHRR